MKRSLAALSLLLAVARAAPGTDDDDPWYVVEQFCDICPACCEVIRWWDDLG